MATHCVASPNIAASNGSTLRKIDVDLLDDISRRSFRYFWEQASPRTGLVFDRAISLGPAEDTGNHGRVASIAATGFGLAAVCIAQDHRWIGHEAARARVATTLRFLAHEAPQKHGWFYHYLDAETGERAWHSEVSSIDTALLLAGVLTVRQCLQDDPEIVNLADTIYAGVDFPWMMDGSRSYFSHGWTPELEFLPYRWDTYSELLILYVLGIGSPTHPIPVDTWGTWNLPLVAAGENTISEAARCSSTNIHRPGWIFAIASSSARPLTLSSRALTITRIRSPPLARSGNISSDLSSQYKGYSADVWGITASDSTKGTPTGEAASEHPRIDGPWFPAPPQVR